MARWCSGDTPVFQTGEDRIVTGTGYLTKEEFMATEWVGFDSKGEPVKDGATIAGDSYNEQEIVKRFKKDARVVKITKNGKKIWKR